MVINGHHLYHPKDEGVFLRDDPELLLESNLDEFSTNSTDAIWSGQSDLVSLIQFDLIWPNQTYLIWSDPIQSDLIW